MTITAKIKHDTIQATANSQGIWQTAVVPYVVTGVDEELQEKQVINFLENNAPRRFQGLPRDTIAITQMNRLDSYEAEITYRFSRNSPTQEEDKTPLEAMASSTLIDMTIDFTSTTINVVYPEERINGILSTEAFSQQITEVDNNLLINEQDDGTAEGVDVFTAEITYTETHELPNSAITKEYLSLVFSMQNTVNSDAFRFFEPGEALFKGASFRRNIKTRTWNVTYEFAGRKNIESVSLPGFDEKLENVKGWHYIWTYARKHTATYEDETFIKAYPLYAFQDAVYKETAFSSLGINASL